MPITRRSRPIASATKTTATHPTAHPPPANPTPRQVLGSFGCAAQLKTHVMDYIPRIEPRRVMIADPETGLVMGFSQFRHPMDQTTEKIVGVPGIESQTMDL